MLESTKEALAAVKTEQKKWYYRCRSNRKAPVLVLETYWEAEEMKTNPEYYQVDADGDLVLDPADSVPSRVPFAPPAPAPKRKVLGLPKKAA